jgi:hypothetical protein
MRIGRGNQNTWRKPAPGPHDMTWDRTQAATVGSRRLIFFNLHSGGVESKLGPLGTSAIEWPIVPAPGDYDDGENLVK